MTKKKSMLRWFGHIEMMSESRLPKGIYKLDVSGNAGRVRPRRTYIALIGEVLQEGHVPPDFAKRARPRL